ncbi:MAG: DUF6351 family protein, partial [Acidimicrobiia bacterium]
MRRGILVFTVVITMLLPAAIGGAAPGEIASIDLEVVSSPPEYVSGGDARILAHVPPGQIDKVSILVDGVDQTDRFEPIDEDTLEGVVDGLQVGANQVTATLNKRSRASKSLTLTNHPITGPIFSGPQQEPFFCSTPGDYGAAELDGPIDTDCSMETEVGFKYR